MTEITIDNKPYHVHIFKTHVGSNAIHLLNQSGFLHVCASVHLPDVASNEVAISDNIKQSLFQLLIDNNIIKPAHRYIDGNPICYLYED